MIKELYIPERTKEIEWGAILTEADQTALFHIERNFERNSDILGNLDYHNRLHTLRVKRRVIHILETIRVADSSLVTDRDLVLGQIGAVFHDAIQIWEEKDGRRKRATGRNEEESAYLATIFMDKINGDYINVFTQEDKDVVKEAIRTTVPGFSNGTVIQPLLNERSHIATKAIALSDVDGCLMDGSRIFLGEGDALFREENLDVMRAFIDGFKNLSSEQIKNFRERMLGWTESQIKFVQGRQSWLEEDLAGIPEPAKGKVKAIFDKGDESIKELERTIEIRKKLSFKDIVVSFGYGTFLF